MSPPLTEHNPSREPSLPGAAPEEPPATPPPNASEPVVDEPEDTLSLEAAAALNRRFAPPRQRQIHTEWL